MSVTPEMINQSVFTAALFLTLISLPRLIALSIWYRYRIWLFRDLQRNIKYVQVFFKGQALEALKNLAEDPKFRVQQTVKEYGNYLKYVRDPLIEASTAWIIMVALIITGYIQPVMSAVSAWLTISVVVILVIIVSALAQSVLFTRDMNRIAAEGSMVASTEDAKKV
jgi:hypothetical protein